jgi:hypothetical protein
MWGRMWVRSRDWARRRATHSLAGGRRHRGKGHRILASSEPPSTGPWSNRGAVGSDNVSGPREVVPSLDVVVRFAEGVRANCSSVLGFEGLRIFSSHIIAILRSLVEVTVDPE